jgi:hypothetical protein
MWTRRRSNKHQADVFSFGAEKRNFHGRTAVGERSTMGYLSYGSKPEIITFDDRLLWHVKLVILAKLRRREGFSFSWRREDDNGLDCVWLHPQCDLVFKFDGENEPDVNHSWLEALMHSANTTGGMHVIPEPADNASQHTSPLTAPATHPVSGLGDLTTP